MKIRCAPLRIHRQTEVDMTMQAGPRVYRVCEDRSCWSVLGRGASLGLFLRKGQALNRAWDAARQDRPSIVTVELADGTVEGEFRFGSASH
jgi:hypothetical protein